MIVLVRAFVPLLALVVVAAAVLLALRVHRGLPSRRRLAGDNRALARLVHDIRTDISAGADYDPSCRAALDRIERQMSLLHRSEALPALPEEPS